MQREYGELSTDESFGLGSCFLAHFTGLDCWSRLLAHSLSTECCVLPWFFAWVLVPGCWPMSMAKVPGSWSSFLARVIGLGSRLWLLAQFQWIWLAHIVGSGYWRWLLAQAVGPCRWPMLLAKAPGFWTNFLTRLLVWVLGSWHIFLAQVSCPEGAFYKVSAQLPGPIYSMSQAPAKLPGSWSKFPIPFYSSAADKKTAPYFA